MPPITLTLTLQQQQILRVMNQLTNFFFSTQVRSEQRPRTTQNLNIQPSSQSALPSSIFHQFRMTKLQMQQTHRAYLESVSAHHQVKRSLDQVNKKSLLKRVQFLKMYSTKKYKYQERELQQSKKRETERHFKSSSETTRRKKLEGELQSILLKNQEQELAMKLQIKNKRETQILKRQIRLKQKQHSQYAHSKYSQIKKGHTQFLIRKNNVSTSLTMRSKHNYLQKVGQELALIKQYNALMDEIRDFQQSAQVDFAPEISANLSLQSGTKNDKTFITTSNTIDMSS